MHNAGAAQEYSLIGGSSRMSNFVSALIKQRKEAK